MSAKRGRPQKAARNLDEALARQYAGESPTRARNDFERAAMGIGRDGKRGGGRKPDPLSPTQQAAQFAAYLVKCDGLSLKSAADHSAQAFGVHKDNVRKYTRQLLKGPQVVIGSDVVPMFRQLLDGAPVAVGTRSLLVSVTDAALPPE